MEEPTDAPAERAAGQGPDVAAPEHLALPLRAVGDVPTVHRVRLTDDPEMLELILAGLLNLP
jgi:hypothetical protein